MCLAKLDPGEREQFLMKLTDFVSTADPTGGSGNGNGGGRPAGFENASAAKLRMRAAPIPRGILLGAGQDSSFSR
jgi:hypothetical protein